LLFRCSDPVSEGGARRLRQPAQEQEEDGCGPLIILLLLGKRATVILPKMRDWMDTNSWIENEIVIGFFLVMAISGMANA
jgi:hypothetical protein